MKKAYLSLLTLAAFLLFSACENETQISPETLQEGESARSNAAAIDNTPKFYYPGGVYALNLGMTEALPELRNVPANGLFQTNDRFSFNTRNGSIDLDWIARKRFLGADNSGTYKVDYNPSAIKAKGLSTKVNILYYENLEDVPKAILKQFSGNEAGDRDRSESGGVIIIVRFAPKTFFFPSKRFDG